MIGKKKLELTEETILNKLTEYDIYRYYLGHDFIIGKSLISPFRYDKSPSLSIFSRDSGLLYLDHGDNRFRGNCITFVMQLFNLSYDAALRKIDSDFGLGILAEKKDYKSVIATYEQPKIEKVKHATIQVVARCWKKEEIDYWAQFSLERKDLMMQDVEVYVPKEIWLNRKRLLIKDRLVFAYLFDKKYWKIYFPYGDKDEKWVSNVPLSHMYNLSSINRCEKAVITKSVKDLALLRKLFPCVAGCQNESVAAISDENITYLKENTKEVYIAFDSDRTGKENSWFYTKTYGFKHLNTPDYLLSEGVKDFSGWAALEGIDIVKDFLIKKKIL